MKYLDCNKPLMNSSRFVFLNASGNLDISTSSVVFPLAEVILIHYVLSTITTSLDALICSIILFCVLSRYPSSLK